MIQPETHRKRTANRQSTAKGARGAADVTCGCVCECEGILTELHLVIGSERLDPGPQVRSTRARTRPLIIAGEEIARGCIICGHVKAVGNYLRKSRTTC